MAALWIFYMCEYNTNFLQTISSGRCSHIMVHISPEIAHRNVHLLNYIYITCWRTK